MDVSSLKAKLLAEVQQVPENRLAALYDLIHHFRMAVDDTEFNTHATMNYAGCWSNLPDQVFDDFVADISSRRQQAFSGRRTDETSDG